MKSQLILDRKNYQINCPIAGGGSYNLSNFIPSVIAHTVKGYVYLFQNADDR